MLSLVCKIQATGDHDYVQDKDACGLLIDALSLFVYVSTILVVPTEKYIIYITTA